MDSNDSKIKNYNTKEKAQSTRKLTKNNIPRPLKNTKCDKKNILKRKLSLKKNDNILLNLFSNSQKSLNKEVIQTNSNDYNKTSYPSSKNINNNFPKRKLTRAKTSFQKCEENEKGGISKTKRKKIKNLQLLIKLVDENEKIENEYCTNREFLKDYRDKMKFEKNKSDIHLYIPCITYNKNNIYFKKQYSMIKKKFNCTKNNSHKYIPTFSLDRNNNNTFRFIYENNILFNKNFPKENSKYESSISLQKISKNKKNINIRKNKKANTFNLQISPYLINNNKFKKSITPREDSENNLYNNYNFSYTNSFNFNTELNMNNYNKIKQKIINNYSYSVKALSKSKSKEKIRKGKFIPLVNEIIKESSKIEKELKNNYKNSKDKDKNEKDKKKKINEIKNLTKRRKINIEALRKKLNLDKNYFEGNKKNNYFDIYDILIKNTNKMKKIVPKNGLNIIKEAANKIIYEDKKLHKDIIYYNNKLLGQFKENKKDKIFFKILEKQKQIENEIIGKPNNKKEQIIQQLKDDISE